MLATAIALTALPGEPPVSVRSPLTGGDVEHEEPTLRRILDDLLQHVWEAGGAHPAPTADEVVEQVRRRRAIVIFDGLDEVLVHLRETQGQALLRELWKILPPPILGDPVRRRTPAGSS